MSRTRRLTTFGRTLPPAESVSTLPDWQQCRPQWIAEALRQSQALPDHGWMVLDASRHIGEKPRRFRVAGEDYVAWRTRSDSKLVVAPDTCPHLGASLAEGRVCDDAIVCPWHGLQLGPQGHGAWRPRPAFDDGVLAWFAPDPSRFEPAGPILPVRPRAGLDAVVSVPVQSDPEDIIANRLDPWHGAHFHPYAFGRLRVVEQGNDAITVRVVYRVIGRYGIEVDARFHCVDPRTIVMTIVRGEGEGSVVETHATPVEPGRSVMVEATIATSERPQFRAVVRMCSWFLRPLVCKAAARLWRDDAAYAERRYALRTREASDSRGGEPKLPLKQWTSDFDTATRE